MTEVAEQDPMQGEEVQGTEEVVGQEEALQEAGEEEVPVGEGYEEPPVEAPAYEGTGEEVPAEEGYEEAPVEAPAYEGTGEEVPAEEGYEEAPVEAEPQEPTGEEGQEGYEGEAAPEGQEYAEEQPGEAGEQPQEEEYALDADNQALSDSQIARRFHKNPYYGQFAAALHNLISYDLKIAGSPTPESIQYLNDLMTSMAAEMWAAGDRVSVSMPKAEGSKRGSHPNNPFKSFAHSQASQEYLSMVWTM